MIVIIKKGTREVTTCNTCGCKFSYEKEDVKIAYAWFEFEKGFDKNPIIKWIN